MIPKSLAIVNPNPHFPNPNPPLSLLLRFPAKSPPLLLHQPPLSRRNLILRSTPTLIAGETPPRPLPLATASAVAAASALLFFSINFPTFTPPLPAAAAADTRTAEEEEAVTRGGNEERELDAAFEAWKSKTFALSVPLRIVALRGSVPPTWVKDFMESQGKRLRLNVKFVGSLENIFSDLSMSFSKPNKISLKSAVAADLVSIGDSWLAFAIKKAIIEPIKGAEDQDWFKGLSNKWKVYLRRNHEGEIDPKGEIWAAPYRWGCMVIAYKKTKFQKHKVAPIEDWADLWRPELTGRISMVDSPREVIGAVLKYMGASYNTKTINLEVAGGRIAVQQNLALLAKQVRLYDSTHYLKAFGVGDVWVAVGWSSDVLPVAKRLSDVAVIVPKSGTSLWADLWAIPAASALETTLIGGRVRGPSPLVHQWMEFCLQVTRALSFKQEVVPGAAPADLQIATVEIPKEIIKGNPRLDTNLIAGVPPPEILARCEFLEPLSDIMLSDYKCLIAGLQNSESGLFHRLRHIFKMFH